VLLLLAAIFLSPSTKAAGDYSGAFVHPSVPAPKLIELEPPTGTLIRANQIALSDAFNFTGTNTFTGANAFNGNFTATAGQNIATLYNLDTIRIVDSNKFATCNAATTDPGVVSVIVPPNYAGAACPAPPPAGVLLWDLRNAQFNQNIAGVFTNTQQNDLQVNNINNVNVGSEFSNVQGGNFATEAQVGAVNCIGTVFQCNGLAGYVVYSSASNHAAVGSYGVARAAVNNANIFGANFLVTSAPGLTGVSMNAQENDINVFNTADAGVAFNCSGAWKAQGTVDCYTVTQPAAVVGGPYTWRRGIFFQTAATIFPDSQHAAVFFNPLATGVNQYSQGITAIANDPVSGTNTITLNETPSGDILFQQSKSGGGLTFGSGNGLTLAPVNLPTNRRVIVPDPGAASVTLPLCFNTTNCQMQTKRGVAGCTTGASIGGTCATDITVTWATAFTDANYSVTCTGSTPTAVPAAPFVVSGTKLAATVHINYFAITAVAASYATIDCIAVHD